MSWGWEWKITGSEFGVWTIILFLPLSWTRHLALLGPCSLWNKGPCSAQLSRVLKRQRRAGGTGGGGGGCVVGGRMAASRTKGWPGLALQVGFDPHPPMRATGLPSSLASIPGGKP